MGRRINLQSLIDEVLSMAKDSQNIRKKKTEDVQPSWYGGNKDEAEYWKDIRARNTALEIQGRDNQARLEEAQINNIGQLARQKMGAPISSPARTIEEAGMGDAMFKTWYDKEGSGESLTPEQLSEKRAAFQKHFGGNTSAPLVNEADAPTPEAIQHALYSGKTDKEFRSAIDNDENLRGMGYVQNLKTGKTTRVINNEVFSGRVPKPKPESSAPVAAPVDAASIIDRGIPDEVKQAERGYKAKYPLWDRWLNALSSQADAEAGIVSPRSIPESPRMIFGRDRSMDFFKRKKKQEEEDIGAYSKWINKNRF